MTASDAREQVLQAYPKAWCDIMYQNYTDIVIYCVIRSSDEKDGAIIGSADKGVEYNSNYGPDARDAAWIDAASRLPSPKPIEPMQVASGDGLPPCDVTPKDEDTARARGYIGTEVYVLAMLACRERQLKESLRRERVLVVQVERLKGLLREAIKFPLSSKVWEEAKAAITEKVSSR